MARENLKAARNANGMTQQQVANHLGISLRNYQKMESGELLGRIVCWDMLEDLFSIHQRELRRKGQANNQQTHQARSKA